MGGIKTLRVDVRLIAATNRDLKAAHRRRDASARTSTTAWPWSPSPCRRCATAREDIPLLVQHFIEKYNRRLDKKIEGIDDEALQLLLGYAWPGQHPRAGEPDGARPCSSPTGRVIAGRVAPRLAARDRAPGTPVPIAAVGPLGAIAAPSGASMKEIVRQAQAELEKDLIARALEETGGNVTRAAKRLQISRKSLQTKMKELGLRGAEE